MKEQFEQLMPSDSIRPDVAVFIDFENVYVSVRDKLDANPNFESIMERCEDLGRVVIARAYADWYRYPRVTSALYANGIEPMYVPTYYYDRDLGRTGRAIKNSVDMNLCVDAMKTLFTNPNIAKFVLATGDRDFIPLVNTIRQQGKEVIIIGVGGAASAHLAQSADEFIFYESLLGKKPVARLLPDAPRTRMPDKGEPEPAEEEAPAQPVNVAALGANGPTVAPPRALEAAPTPSTDIYDVLVQAIGLARERGYVCSFGSLKLLMKELMGGEFKENRYKDAAGRPFAKFKDFVLEAERRGKVQVFTNGTVNEVFLPGEDPFKLSQFAQDLKEEPPPPLQVAEQRADSRLVGSNGRSRRRRRPRGQRQGPPPLVAGETPETPSFDDELMAAVAEQLRANDHDVEIGDVAFEELLDRIDQEEVQLADMAELDLFDAFEVEESPEEDQEQPSGAGYEQAEEVAEEAPAGAADEAPVAIEEAPPEPPAAQAPGEVAVETDVPVEPEPEYQETAPEEGALTVSDRPFSEDEWDVLRRVVSGFERPVSFAQIHDGMRDARNRNEILRTNEELRSLIKTAINSNVLERSGKGARIVYRLSERPQIEVLTDHDQASLVGAEFGAPLVADPALEWTPQEPDDEPTGESAPFESPAEGSDGTPVEPELRDRQPQEAPVEYAAPEPGEPAELHDRASMPALEEAELAPPARRPRQRRKPPAGDAVQASFNEQDSSQAEPVPAPPKKSRSRRKKDAAPGDPAAAVEPVEYGGDEQPG